MNSTLIIVLFAVLFGLVNCAPSSPDDSIAQHSESSADDLKTASTFYASFGFPGVYGGYGGYGGSPYGYGGGYPGSYYGGYGSYGYPRSYYGYGG